MSGAEGRHAGGGARDEVRAGAALSYVNIIALNLANLLFTPLLLRSLGQSGYGLYSLIGSVAASISVLDLGLGTAITRYVAQFRASGDEPRQAAFVGLCVRIYSLLAVVAIAAGALLHAHLDALLGNSIAPAEMRDARTMFVLMVANVAVSLPLGAFAAVITGYERFVFLRVATLARLVVRVACLTALLLLGYKAVAIVVVDTALNIAMGFLNVAYAVLRLRIRIGRATLERPFVRQVAIYSLFVFMNVVVDQLYWRIGHVVLGITAGTAAVALFALATQLAQYYMQFSTALSSVFLPRITMMVAGGRPGAEVDELFARTARVQFLVLGYIFGAFALFGREFIALWAGPGYAPAWSLAMILMVPLTIPLFQNVGIQILHAKNKHAFRSVTYLCIAAANVLLTFELARRYGTVGAALATGAALVVANVVIINLYYHYVVGIDVPLFFRRVTRGLLPAAALALCAGSAMLLVDGQSWLTFSGRALGFSVAYAAAMWFVGMDSSEKAFLISAARRRVPGGVRADVVARPEVP